MYRHNRTRGWVDDVIWCIIEVLWLCLVDIMRRRTTSRLTSRLSTVVVVSFCSLIFWKRSRVFQKLVLGIGSKLTEVDFCNCRFVSNPAKFVANQLLIEKETTLTLVSAFATAITQNLSRIVHTWRTVFFCGLVLVRFITLWRSRGSDMLRRCVWRGLA